MIGGTDLDISCSSRSRRDDISQDAQSSIIESMAADIDLTVLCSDAITGRRNRAVRHNHAGPSEGAPNSSKGGRPMTCLATDVSRAAAHLVMVGNNWLFES
jgi:hypothetical protein